MRNPGSAIPGFSFTKMSFSCFIRVSECLYCPDGSIFVNNQNRKF